MVIEGKNFRISNDGESVHWDLQLMRTVRPRGKPEREELGDPLYGIPLEKAIKIITYNVLSKEKDTYELQEFIQRYLEEIKKVKELFKDL